MTSITNIFMESEKQRFNSNMEYSLSLLNNIKDMIKNECNKDNVNEFRDLLDGLMQMFDLMYTFEYIHYRHYYLIRGNIRFLNEKLNRF